MAQLITDASLVVRNLEILDAQRDEQKVLFHPTAGLYCDLDKVATRVWNLLDTPQSLDELVAALTAQYQVDRDTCRMHTRQFLMKLQDKGFISIAAPASQQTG